MATSQLVEISARIAANTAKLNDYLIAHNLPIPSFNEDGPSDTMIPKDELEIEAARHNELISQQAIFRFRLAHSFPVGAEASFTDIAAFSGLQETTVRQIIRRAIVKGIFIESRPGVVAHNSVSRLLAEDQVIHDWVGASTDDLWQGATQTCNALEKFPGSQEPNETGFALANHTDRSVYEEFAKFPERARRFANAMRSFTEGTGFNLSYLVENFPWGTLGNGTVVDVGGSQGFACFAIANRFPELSFVVQDLAPVVTAAEHEAPAELSDRIKFMEHNFFTEQPIRGADVYLFRWIFHNWSDKYSIKILRSLIPALKIGVKIVINDNVLPQPGVLSRWQEERLRSMDLTMTEMQNSHEREVDDWAKLFKGASPGFEFQEAKQPRGSDLWILITEWKGN
ncbi:hypothetical protein N0V93_002104 [Gnomoniopsis smithogilvyi]|uniref:O-methyltransferase C-terminal domain-containing protein n=1 Tax=Gnomoniopsis smithogilvyi TaxID=1191159 RepID=A0A9W8Z2X6_9PEZI|nr:hypothetical protein N0V93_002104 [Gnomoniopsis smithogilvyi]